MFKYYFTFIQPSDLEEKLFEIKDKNKNNDFVKDIKNRWSELKDKTEKMSRNERENKRLDKIL